MARLLSRLQRGQFAVTVEVDPPRGPDAGKTLSRVRRFADLVDAVNVADCPMANVRMSPITLAHLIQRDGGVEAIFHLTCRDRNIIGLQAELLGAAGLGVRNILTLRGDDPARGDHPAARGVFEIDSKDLISLAAALNSGRTAGGGALEQPTDFAVGCVANPNADDIGAEVARLEAKVASGAHFVQTQPLFSQVNLERWLRAINGRIRIPILYGILPLRDYDFALHLNRDVPGMAIPQSALEGLRAGGPGAGLKLVRDLLAGMSTEIHGIHIFPLGSVERTLGVLEILDELGLRARRPALVAQ